MVQKYGIWAKIKTYSEKQAIAGYYCLRPFGRRLKFCSTLKDLQNIAITLVELS